MDELRSFFNPGPASSQVIKLRGPLTGGHRITKLDPTNELNRVEAHRRSEIMHGTEYAHELKEREIELYRRNEIERHQFDIRGGGMESLEYLPSSVASTLDIHLTEEAMTEVYSKYSFQKKEDTNNLAINECKQEILTDISANPVVIVEGPTGCGKTTQVPQWILDSCHQACKPCKIVVTQPRRIAAISIAKRVAQERGWEVGDVVGYQVGLDNKTTADTRIQYVTTGVLLQKLVGAKTMNEYTHVILDEVHERGQEMDFLLLVVKRLLYTVSPHVKVVLMSATINRRAFADYFSTPTPHGKQMSCCINVDKKEPMFNVKKFYLGDLNKFGNILQQSSPSANEAGIVPEMHHLVVKLVNAFENIDKIEENYGDRSEAEVPSVLIFLPGINEIEDLYSYLTDLALREKIAGPECPRYKWRVLPLHSTITADEQVRVFQRAPPGQRKIILSTNIAESSITVPDIKYVIDYCLMKVLVADPETNFTSLELQWAAKNNCEQRAGRAGRVRDGRVYRLVSEKFYDTLPREAQPEMVRCPLERLVLLAKMLDFGPPVEVLALAMDPPDMANIQRTMLVLKELGALKKTVDDQWSNKDGDITYLGRVMAKLPLDVRASKLIMLGHIYGCLEEAVVMAAAMSVKNVFSSPFRERLNAYNSKLTWADGSTSDCIAFLNVYRVWDHLRKQQYFRQAGHDEAAWARRFYVQVRALRELHDLVRELRARLSREGIDPPPGKAPWTKHELSLVYKILAKEHRFRPRMIREAIEIKKHPNFNREDGWDLPPSWDPIILAGAFYPQYFVQVSSNEERERDAVKLLNGLDPRTTVYLKNFPDNQPGEIYSAAIKKVVRQTISDEPRVTFDNNSRKVYLTFDDGRSKSKQGQASGDPTIPGQVVLPVYKAIKARQLRIDIRIPMLPVERADELAMALKMDKMSLDLDMAVPRLPEIDDTHVPLTISHLTDVGTFWVQYDDESTMTDLRTIHKQLNNSQLVAYTGHVAAGDLYAAPYTEAAGTAVYRARVVALAPRDMFEVSYIDYGSVGRVHACNLRELPGGASRGLPPLCMRGRLAALAPAPLLDAHWSGAATACFQHLASRGRLLAKVYSVVHGVVAIELLAEGGQLNVNQELLKRGFAIPCEESYESKMNHDLRQMATELNMSQKRAYNREQKELAYCQTHELEPPSAKECISDVCLKGPFSPLESSLHNLMYAKRESQVVVEWNSVNSVLLDTDPQQNYQRLVVAGSVGSGETSSKLTLRHTTLMPNIPGLPAVLALLFSPAAELRRSESNCRYVSVLCGLGSAESGRPYFPEHDILVDIDADLTIEDIGLINHIRYLMDYMMYCGDGQDVPTVDDEFRAQVPKLIKKDLMDLLTKRRKRREPEMAVNAWEWRSVDPDELLEITLPDMLERAAVYPLHAPLELYPPSRERMLALKRENDMLKMVVTRTPMSSSAELQCKLCGTPPTPTHAMRIHLYSNAHKEKEEDLKIFDS